MTNISPASSNEDDNEESSLRILLDHALRSRPTALEILSLLSFVGSAPADLLQADDRLFNDSSIARLRRLIKSIGRSFKTDVEWLSRHGMVVRPPEAGVLTLAPQFRPMVQQWLRSRDLYDHGAAECVKKLSLAFPNPFDEYWSICCAIRPHAESIMAVEVQHHALLHKAALAYKLGWFCWRDRDTSAAEKMIRTAKQTFQDCDAGRSRTSCQILLALVLKDCGRLAEAATVEEEVQSDLFDSLGIKHPSTVISVGNLTSTYWLQDELFKAGELARPTMEIGIEELGLDHPGTMILSHNLATILWSTGDVNRPVYMLEELIERRTRLLGADHPDTIMSMINLALMKASQDQESRKRARLLISKAYLLSQRQHDHLDGHTLCEHADLAARSIFSEESRLHPGLTVASISWFATEHPMPLVTVDSFVTRYWSRSMVVEDCDKDDSHPPSYDMCAQGE